MIITPDCPECGGLGHVPFDTTGLHFRLDRRPCSTCCQRWDDANPPPPRFTSDPGTCVKLLHCDPLAGGCGDVVRIYNEWRACHCGKSRARYVSDVTVSLMGPCRALGLDTGEVLRGESGAWSVSRRTTREDAHREVRRDREGRPINGPHARR